MASCDYRLCDVCGGKAFYNANLNYDHAERENDPESYRIAGEPQKWGTRLDYLGDWAVLCSECAKTHRTQIVPIAAPQAEKHPDDAAVDRFAAAMKSKLAEKRRQGKSGWDDPRCPTEYLAALLHEHVVKGDPLDVGNFAMMLWCRGGSTNETQTEPKRPIIEVITEFDDIANWYGVILVVGETRHRFFIDYYTMQLADAEDFAETLRKALGITGDSDADR